jgi:hypothetical protein
VCSSLLLRRLETPVVDGYQSIHLIGPSLEKGVLKLAAPTP